MGLKTFYGIALSDPSPVELLAIIVGIILCTASIFYLMVETGYEASLISSPVNPFGSIKGYVSGYEQEIPLLSLETIRHDTAKVFLELLYGSKIYVWLVYIASLFITGYPILSRLKNTFIPGMSIASMSIDSIVFASAIPLILLYLGYSSIFLALSLSTYMFYFGMGPDHLFLSVVAGTLLFMLLLSLVFYVAFIATGRIYFGTVIGFLLSLAFDKVEITSRWLIIVSIIFIVAVAFTLYLLVRTRRMNI